MKSMFRFAFIAIVAVAMTGCVSIQGGKSSCGSCVKKAKACDSQKKECSSSAKACDSKKKECSSSAKACDEGWVSLLNGKDLSNWNATGTATWEYKDGMLVGSSSDGKGHLYAGPIMTDMEVRGRFRLSNQGGGSNSGLYFRAKPSKDNPESWPTGYEAQICHNQAAHTGYMWKPGDPVGKATKLLTKDGEWFDMRAQAIGTSQKIWVNGELVMEFEDGDYTDGNVAIQVHNAGMTIEAKDLQYRDLSNCKKACDKK